ncbi:PIG-P-domain-containing protein [Patellaria atrata CBS 101060]|uniref:PIG-P-domain-containing protein n=1 Tax=Patellaria atrata CBS 101060 TaxID=1346257 RepID=A0A9P4SHF8_9PEZI|nr:PIG-P-domain-containing protein [Patellaria atrata CBS 101060]
MPPQSRGSAVPPGFQSKSTPNLPTLSSLELAAGSVNASKAIPASPAGPPSKHEPNNPLSPTILTSPSEPASVETTTEPDPDADPLKLDIDSTSSTSSEDDLAVLPNRPLYQHSSRSYTHLPRSKSSSGLFPPFYNRPPTPLPPSPSLTSLLRPSFSATTSRPTTPDSSDVELPSASADGGVKGTSTGGTATGVTTPSSSLARTARTAAPVPRASPKVPTYEYYGFALYLASSASFLMYVLWSYLPSPFLHQLGIHYYPNRWWSLAIPAWLVILIVYIYIALASYNVGYLTIPMQGIENLVDSAAQIAVLDRNGKIIRTRTSGVKGRSDGKIRSAGHSRHTSSTGLDIDWKKAWSEGTDAVMDVPIGGVCEILYGEEREYDAS